MKRFRQLMLGAGLAALGTGAARADDGRPGSVVWSDGHKLAGAISLTPGKELRLFTKDAQVSLELDEVKEIRFKPEKEEMQEGFYFPNAGQATQAKTGEVYPVRQLQTEITLSDGKVLEGHLFTTTLYVETDQATEKVVLMAKQTGADGQKLSDLTYPSDILFDAGSPASGSSQIDLTQAGFADAHQIVVVARPDLGLLPASQTAGKPVWTVPSGNPGKIFFAVQAADGIHVAWPPGPYMGNIISQNPAPAFPEGEAEADPAIHQAVETALKVMQDFYDTRTLLGCFADGDDVYALVMMKRVGTTYSFSADKIPWSLVMLRWKYDPEQKKVMLLNRANLATARAEGNSSPPAVFKEPGLLRDIAALPVPAPEGTHP